jgi:hypothetical protein
MNWRIARLWPEAVLAVLTIWMVVTDGLGFSAGDPGYYYQVAGQVSDGLMPYRDFPFEYPPVSLPAILLPYFLPGGASVDTFLRYLFSENVLMLAGTGLAVMWLARRGWSSMSWLSSGLYFGVLALTLAPAVVWRFDALPTLLTVLAVVAVALRRPSVSGLALGTAIMSKLYPLAMLPALTIGQIRGGRLRPAIVLVVVTIATAALIALPLFLVAGSPAFAFLEIALARGVQVESVPGAIALLAGVLGGPDARIFHGFGTFQVDSPLVPILLSIWTLLTVVMIASLGLAIWRRYGLDVDAAGGLTPTSHITHLLAALMVALVASRILSPQYLIWVVPFVAMTSRPKALVFWVACLLTTFVYPLNYFEQFLNKQTYTVVAVNARNAILVGFMIWVIAPDLKSALGELARRARSLGSKPRLEDSPSP